MVMFLVNKRDYNVAINFTFKIYRLSIQQYVFGIGKINHE